MKRWRSKLGIILYIGVFLCIWAIFTWKGYQDNKGYRLDEINRRLTTVATSAAILIGDDLYFQQIINRRGWKAKDIKIFERVNKKLNILVRINFPFVVSIQMIALWPDNTWRYVLDSSEVNNLNENSSTASSNERFSFGEKVDLSLRPGLSKVLRENLLVYPIEPKPVKDKLGVWYSGYTTIRYKGDVVGVVIANSSADMLNKRLKQSFIFSWFIFLILSFMTAIVGYVLWKWEVAKEVAQSNEKLYYQLTEVSVDIFFALNPDGTVRFINQQVRHYGYDPEKLVGCSVLDIIVPEHHSRFEEKLEKVKNREDILPFSISIKTTDEYIRHGECRCFGVYKGDKLVTIWGMFRDLTDLLELNLQLTEKAQALEKATADWKLTFDIIGSGIAILDENFTIVRVNQALADLLQVKPHQIIGQKCYQCLHPWVEDGSCCPYEPLVKAGESGSYEVNLPSGQVWQVKVYPYVVDKRLQRVIHSYRDITLERKAQQLLQRTERLITIGQMVAGVTHEINNPLNAIVGMTELLMDEVKGQNQRKLLTEIQQQALRIGSITQSLLTFARPQPSSTQFIDINGRIREVLDLKSYDLKSRNIRIVLKLQQTLPFIQADETQILQVFLNLINNAQDAMEESGGTLTLATESDGQIVRVIVEDTGDGIPADLLPHIFDPFFTTKPIGKGTGLGLSITYGIVMGHGGRIWAENRPNGGAKFVVEFPVALPLTTKDEPKEELSKSHSLMEGPQNGSDYKQQPKEVFRVLVIDNEPNIISVLCCFFTREGYDVDSAINCKQALDLLKERNYDLILCDLGISGTNGNQILSWLQQNKPDLTKCFAFMTGDFVNTDFQATLSRQGVRIIYKPFSFDEVRTLLNKDITEQ